MKRPFQYFTSLRRLLSMPAPRARSDADAQQRWDGEGGNNSAAREERSPPHEQVGPPRPGTAS